MPAFEDKVVQRAGAMLLGAIYAQDFHECSYGFREGRSPHQALHVLRERCMHDRIGWIIDADVSTFFDSLDHDLVCEGLTQRVNDGAIRRLIRKWLRAGVLEGDTLSYLERGSPQGGVISPMLANLFLDHVLDEWFERDVMPRMKGRCVPIRYADDGVIGCEREDEARRILAVLPKRLARFKLTIHPQKTRLVRFQPPRNTPRAAHAQPCVPGMAQNERGARPRARYARSRRRGKGPGRHREVGSGGSPIHTCGATHRNRI
jgi:group II intron reverse transcriptase/maturase